VTACTIRRAGPADAAALAAFGERTFREAFGPANTPANTDMYVRQAYGAAVQGRELADPQVATLVAVDVEGALTGYAQVRRRSAPPGIPERSCELWRFYVDRPWQGQGLARELMAAVRQLAKDLGGEALWLAVWEHNPRARAFYLREGFHLAGSQPFQLGEDLQTDLVMVTSLGPDARRVTGDG
jgi:ribosomal protein S18 acetylase RimI-like enzyme